MKNIFKKVIPLTTAMVVGLPTCIVSSCGALNPEIESITLSARYEYIHPNEELKIKAKLFPILSSKENLIWSIDSPVDGFTISDEGWLKAPEAFGKTDSFPVQIKAVSKSNPNVFDTFSVLAIPPEKQSDLLGLSGELEYLDRDGKPTSRKILKRKNATGGDLYYLEGADPGDPIEKQDGINFYTGRIGEYIKFTPIFKPDANKYMKFKLYNDYGDDERFNCLSWVGYKDNEPTLDVPNISASTAWYKRQMIYVEFACEEHMYQRRSSLQIICDVYLNQKYNSDPVFDYKATPEEGKEPKYEDEHSVSYVDEGMYTSQIICSKGLTQNTEKRIGDIYLYRKPYEEMEQSLKGVWEPNINAPNIFTEDGKPKVSELKFGKYLPESLNYLIATFDVTYTVDQNLIQDLDYESFLIGSYKVYDISDVKCEWPISTLDFWVQWIEE